MENVFGTGIINIGQNIKGSSGHLCMNCLLISLILMVNISEKIGHFRAKLTQNCLIRQTYQSNCKNVSKICVLDLRDFLSKI